MLKFKSKLFTGLMVALFVLGAVAIAHADTINLPSTGVKKTSGATVIKSLQSFLNWSLGSQIVPLVVDGKYGAKTTSAIKAYQSANGLVADGAFGKLSAAKAMSLQANGGPVSYGNLCPNGMTLSSNCTVAPSVNNPAPVITNGQVNAMLASDNPAAGNILAGQAIADLAHFAFSNGTSSPVSVTSVKLTRTGYSDDTQLVNVYLYNGNVRITDSASVSAGVITFNDSTGLFTIPANGSIVVAVKADIKALFAGTAGVTLTGYTAGGLTNTVSIVGNTMYGISTTLTTVQFGNVAVSPTSNSTDPTTDYVVWRKSDVQIGTHDVMLKSFRLRQIGSVLPGDIQNFRLYVDGTQVGPTIASLGSDGYLTFDLSSAPVTLKSGNRDLKVVADIISGSSRTFSFSLRTASDLNVVDSQVNANILATGNGTTDPTAAFSSMSATSATINPGALTMTKSTDSPTSTVVLGGSNILLGKWDVKATGEQMKVENLYINVIPSRVATTSLRNGAFYFNGVQIGSTASVMASAAGTGTQYTFGSSFVVNPGTPGVLEFRADNYAATGTAIAANDTFQAQICNAACNAGQTGSNVQRKVSLTYGSFPAAVSSANILTATVGTFTMAKDQAYGNQTIVVPKTPQLLGQFSLTSGSSDTVNADTITATITSSSTAGSTDISNLYVMYGTKTSSVKSSITTATTTNPSVNTWSIGETIPANTTLIFKVYGDVASTMATSTGFIDTSLLVSGTSSNGTQVTTGTIVGQRMTAATTGVLTVSLDAATPVASQVVAGTTDQAGSLRIKLSGTNEDIYVKKIVLGISAATTALAVTASPAIASIDLQMATTSTGTFTSVGTAQTVINDGTTPGNVTWNLTGSGRILVARNSSVYLKAVPTYVSSGQTSVSGKAPKLALMDLQAEGTSAMTPGGTGANLVNVSGIVIQANGSSTYVASGDTIDIGTAGAPVAAADTTLTVTNNTEFAPGDVIFVDGNQDTTWDPATEELMTVVRDAGTVLTVRRGTYGTTAHAYTNAVANYVVNVYRLSGIVGTYPNASIVGNAMTVLNTKLGIALSPSSPSGATSAGNGKIVFAFTVSAANNPADVATNTATLTYVDITTVKSGVTTLANLTLYPSEYDTNGSYATTCGALTLSKWRCILVTAGNTNQIDENTSRTYIVRGDTNYAANGSIDISIAALGTSNVVTNSVSWTDGVSAAQVWVNQGSTYVQNASPLSSAVASGTADTVAPTMSSIVVHNAGTIRAIDAGDTITITFNEMVDPSIINANLIPGVSAADTTATVTGNASTGGLACATTPPAYTCTVKNITTFVDTFAAGTTVLVTGATTNTKLSLNTAGTILTVTVTAVAGGEGVGGTGNQTFTAGTTVLGTTTAGIRDANGTVMASVASPVPTPADGANTGF